MRRDDLPRHQAVLAEIVDDPIQLTFEEQVPVLDEDAIDQTRREGRQGAQDRLGIVDAQGDAARLASTTCVGRG